MAEINNFLLGSSTAERVARYLASKLPRKSPVVDIVLFKNDDFSSLYRAATYSALSKLNKFHAAGVTARLITEENWNNYYESLHEVFNSEAFKIIQTPLPVQVSSYYLDNDPTNLDHLYGFPAVCEAAYRLVKPFLNEKIVIVGGYGYFGSRMIELLKYNGTGENVYLIDKGISLDPIKECNVIIAAASATHIIDAELLNSNHIVIDIGYYPVETGGFGGNIHPDALHIPKLITPVPGGMGPFQVAVLLERYAKKIGVPLNEWAFSDVIS